MGSSGTEYFRSFELDLSVGLDHLWRGFHKKAVRYAIKRAERNGVQITVADSERDMRTFYYLNVRTRRKHGVPPQPYRFFRNLWEVCLSRGWGFLVLAHWEGDLIAGSVFLTYKNTIVHKFNASDPEYLEHQPNHALLWYAIQWGCKHGTTRVDLGRTSPDNRGLMDFKRRCGAVQRPLPYFYYASKQGAASTEERSLRYRMLRLVCQRSPLPVLEAAGGALYRHLG